MSLPRVLVCVLNAGGNLPDPAGRPPVEVRELRDKVARRVRELEPL